MTEREIKVDWYVNGIGFEFWFLSLNSFIVFHSMAPKKGKMALVTAR